MGAAVHTVGPITKMGASSTSVGARAIARAGALHGLAFWMAGEAMSLMNKLSGFPLQNVAVSHTDTFPAVVSTRQALTRAWAPASPRGAQWITHFALCHAFSQRPVVLDVKSLLCGPPQKSGPVQRVVVTKLLIGTYVDTPSTNFLQGPEAQRRDIQVLHDQQGEAPIVEASAPDGRQVGKKH